MPQRRKPKVLTDVAVRNLPPAPRGQRYQVADAIVPGLKVRVTANGGKSYVLWRRYGGPHPTARVLGVVGVLSLAKARDKARAWLEQIQQGQDPRKIEEQATRARKEAEANQHSLTFAVLLDDYLARHVKGQRSAREVGQVMRKELLPRWKAKLVTEITRNDVVRVIDAIKDRGALRQAHHVFGHIRTFFNWAIERGSVQTSPCASISAKRMIGPKVPRKRVLTDAELRAFWDATAQFGYPLGPLFRLLLLSGQRLSEVAEASWSEFNLEARLWTIPQERFKSDAVQTVPLTDAMVALLNDLPRFKGGDFIFSNTGGKKPVNGFGQAKVKLDAAMLVQAHIEQLPHFVLHDLRRTVRTRLSSLRVPTEVSELVIGHGPKGMQRVYDLHTYQTEMREALEAWNLKLQTIITPPPANVASMRAAAS